MYFKADSLLEDENGGAFALAGGLIEFAPFQRHQDLVVPLSRLADIDPAREFQVTLMPSQELPGESVIDPERNTATVQLVADAGAGGVVSVARQENLVASEDQSFPISVTISRGGSALAPVNVKWAVTCAMDVRPATATVYIAPDVQSQVAHEWLMSR